MMSKKMFSKFAAFLLSFCGVGILLYTLLPIVTFNSYSTDLQDKYLSPIPKKGYSLAEDIDYTKADNWFADEKTSNDFSDDNLRYYNISIPKLGIKNATVAVGGEDLSDSLIQYPGTALPGKTGNSVIFGHSILPQFYNPENYLSIFSTLSSMRKGDKIEIRYDGVTYKYLVEDLFEVLPTDIEILEQNKSDSYITLVTCTPPGDPRRPKRLIVRAKLSPYNSLSQI